MNDYALRRRNLAAAITSVAVFGLSVGQAVPLMTLLLERRGTDPVLNGLNAGASFIGVIAGPLLVPSFIRRLGIRNFLLGSFAADIVLFLAMKAFDSLGSWFALRMLLGLVGSGLFTASEAWINLLVQDATRGRIIGVYASALSAGFGLGPLVLSVTGITGWTPFLVNSAIVAVAMLPLLGARNEPAAFDGGRRVSPLVLLWRAKLIIGVVALFGLYESAMLALVPIWGVRVGLTVAEASALITAAYLGAVGLQVPIGIISDRAGRAVALRLCSLAGATGAALLTAVPMPLAALYVVLLLWGGIASGIYPVALGMAGDRFAGSEMVAANAAIIIGYGLGALVGPALGGLAMDLWNPNGLLVMFVVFFAVLLGVATRVRG